MVTKFKRRKEQSYCRRICISQKRIEELLSTISPTRYLENKAENIENTKYDKNEIFKLLIRMGIIPGNLSLEEKRDAWIYRYKRQLKKYNNYTNYNYVHKFKITFFRM